MKNNLNTITSKLKAEMPKVQSEYHVQSLELFGSFLRNEQTNKSDLDILVSFSKAPSLFKFIELEDFLSELLGIKVDLVMKSALKPHIGKKILAEARPIV
jgi:hypothetical protein